MTDDTLLLAGRRFRSRVLLGTARYPDLFTLQEALKAGQTEIITVSMRRFSQDSVGILQALDPKLYTILPNTAGCYTAQDAILTARLAREALKTDWIKLEVIADEETLYPHTTELLQAAEVLISEGFSVFPYCSDDPALCLQLARMGCVAVMPLASPIGSGMGLCNPYNLRLIRRRLPSLPLIVDAGIGTPSDVVLAMELGADAVLINTAVAQAEDPITMAQAMYHASVAGRLGYRAGRIPKHTQAIASSPPTSTLYSGSPS